MKENEFPPISYEMIQEITNPTYFNRGQSYQRSGMVKKGWIIENGIKAKVRGNYNPYYLVEINVSDTMELTGRCTCPVGFGCKHSVAACLQYLYEPDFFIKLKSYKSSHPEVSEEKYLDKIEIQEELGLNTVSVQDWVSSLPPEVLKTKFIELWNHFAPTIFKDLINPNYPYDFWFNQLEDINDFDDSTSEIIQNKKSTSWFTPLKLLEFLNDSDLFIPILHNWTQSFIQLGREIKHEFNSIGICENEIDFDSEFYFVDEDYDEYENRWDYDYDYDYDPESLAGHYFSQFKEIFEEMGRFYGTLKYENLSDLAENFFDFGIKWFLDLELSEYENYGLGKLYEIQRKFAEKIQGIQIMNYTGKERIDFLLQMYIDFKSAETKEKLFNELKLLSNQLNIKEKVREILQRVIEVYKIEMKNEDFLFLLELCDKYSHDDARAQNLIKNTIFHIEKHAKNPEILLNSILNYYGIESHERMEWLYFLIVKGEINGQKIIDRNFIKNKRFVCSYCFEWFLKYYLPKGEIIKITELCESVLKYSPSTFRFNHYSMIKKYSKNDLKFQKEFSQFLKNQFLPNLIKKNQFNVANKIFLNEQDYSEAISLTLSYFNKNRAWDIIKKIHSEIVITESKHPLSAISKDDFSLLIKIINQYIRESMKLKARNRPDFNISQAVQLCLYLYKFFNIESEGNKWFEQFCKNYKRFHNLRSSLKSIGIEMV